VARGKGVAYLRVFVNTHAKMKVSGGLGMVVGPVRVEIFGRKTLLAVIEELNVIHALEILSACLFVGEGTAFC